MNVSTSNPTLLSTAPGPGQSAPKTPMAGLAFLTLVLNKFQHLRVDGIMEGWHQVLFWILVVTFFFDVFLDLLRSTTAGMKHACNKAEPLWPTLTEMSEALIALGKTLLPPRWRKRSGWIEREELLQIGSSKQR